MAALLRGEDVVFVNSEATSVAAGRSASTVTVGVTPSAAIVVVGGSVAGSSELVVVADSVSGSLASVTGGTGGGGMTFMSSCCGEAGSVSGWSSVTGGTGGGGMISASCKPEKEKEDTTGSEVLVFTCCRRIGFIH